MSEETATATALTPDIAETGGDDASTGEQTTAESTEATEQTEEKPASPEEEGAPETYDDFSIPDGMELDGNAIKSFTPIARDLNLTQAQAQQLVDYYAKQIDGLQASQMEQAANIRKGWVESIAADEEIGGAQGKEKLALAVKALDKYGTLELRQALRASGLGDHPEMVRVFYRIGKAMAEDKIEGGEGSQPPADQRSVAEILYPNQGKI